MVRLLQRHARLLELRRHPLVIELRIWATL
jgi:hypothetical protein